MGICDPSRMTPVNGCYWVLLFTLLHVELLPSVADFNSSHVPILPVLEMTRLSLSLQFEMTSF